MKNYDLEIHMCVTHNQPRYAQRLADFKVHGLQNIKDCKILLSLLVGTEKIEDIEQGWPENIEVRQIKSKFDHQAAKTYDYYSNYDFTLISAKWFVRVDDDSATNIADLMDFLNTLNEKEGYYFTTEMYEGNTAVERDLIKSLSIKVEDLSHEVECCILSQNCFQRILSDPVAKNLLKTRSAIEDGYTDICLAITARMIGIFPTRMWFLTKEPDVKSFFAKSKFHIHYIAHDMNTFAWQILTSRSDRENLKFTNKDLLFCCMNKSEDLYEWITSIRLLPSGEVFHKEIRPKASAIRLLWNYNTKNQALSFFGNNIREISNQFIVPNEADVYVQYETEEFRYKIQSQL